MAKAAILEQTGSLTIGEVKLADPLPHEVLIDTKACGLCHSDLHFIDGAYVEDTNGTPIPVIYPATGETIAAASRTSALKRLDFPLFGRQLIYDCF